MARVDFAFAGLRLTTDERLLTPREWTAAQSRWAAELLPTLPPGPVLELCAGAGHIGLAAVHESDRPLVAVDREETATTHVLLNAGLLGISDRVEARCSRLEDAVAPHEQFALVIADPPWVRRSDIGRYPQDPPEAIDGGTDGLDIARGCVQVIDRHLAPGGAALLQVGSAQQVSELELPRTLAVDEVREFPRGALVRMGRPAHPTTST